MTDQKQPYCDGCGTEKTWVDGDKLCGEPSMWVCTNEDCGYD